MMINEFDDDQAENAPQDQAVDRNTALVVDDSRAIRLVLGNFLRELGFTVREAENGQMALAAATQDKSIRMILLDWEMPVMSGIEFLKAWRCNPEWREDIPVLMVTNITRAEKIAEALAAGVSEYVMKPATKELIAAKFDILGIPYRNSASGGSHEELNSHWST